MLKDNCKNYVQGCLDNEKRIIKLEGGDRSMTDKDNLPVATSTDNLNDIFPDGADLNGDKTITKRESNIYDFCMDMVRKNNEFNKAVVSDTQKNAKWMSLGTMAFLLVSSVLGILQTLVSLL